MGAEAIGADFSPKPPVKPLTPAEEAARFILPAGYHMELVASDPDIVNPAVVEFDGNGRMFVAELRSYMPDADGSSEHDPVSRISMWESTKSDGRYDRHTVFADNLILPRAVLPLDGSILTNETDSNDLIKLTDTNGDGVADKREVFYTGVGDGRDSNLEHQQSGFVWGLDNRIYSTYNSFRLRWTPNGILREATGPNYGQWGLTQDDYGRMWFLDAGGEKGPMNFQIPIVYGAFSVSDQIEPGFDTVWPAAMRYGDVEGGMRRVRVPVGTLNHFTATCGPAIVRGDRLPADLRGDLLFAEPVGRLIRRAKIVETAGLIQLRNAYPGSEFVLSTDPLFRPVNMTTAPDGTIFIADMYHGIIQESEWTKPGSYLRRKIEQYQLDKVVGHGRIWRLVYEGLTPDTRKPQMLNETPAQLVAHLSDPNGWWRDTAQRLLVLKQDKSVVPQLRALARSSPGLLERFHALWTLEGLSSLDAALVRELIDDANPQMRVQAIRASETLYRDGETALGVDYRARAGDGDARVAMQALLTLNLFKVPDIRAIVTGVQAANQVRGVQEIGNHILQSPAFGRGGRGGAVTVEQQDSLRRGATIYGELCFSCHGTDGKGAPMANAPAGTLMAPPLAGSPRVQGHRDYVIKALLHGLTGPVEGSTYSGVMIPMGSNNDEWIASIASFVRTGFDNTGALVTPSDVARVRAATAARKSSWTVPEIESALPVPLPAAAGWKATASVSSEMAASALAGTGTWTSAAPQQPGMWFQVELPEPAAITEIQIDAPANGGRGAGGAATPAAVTPAAPGAAAGPPARGTAPGGAPGPVPALGAAQDARGGFGPRAAPPAASLGYPRGYAVQLSTDGATWGAPVAQGEGTAPTTVMAFPPARAKVIRITQTATADNAPAWAIQRIRVYQAAAERH